MNDRRTPTYLLLAVATTALAACSFNPFGGNGTSTQQTSGASKAPTQSATTTSSARTVKTKFAKSPPAWTDDHLLASGSWGYFTDEDILENRLKTGVTNTLHEDLEQDEIDDLTVDQYYDLLKIFRKSPRIDRVIRSADGDPDDATYTVVDIQASDDVAVSTPWVYATLRAEFPTDDGKKRLDCDVYRLKTSKGLDERPFVSSTVVGWARADGTIADPKEVLLVH